MRYDYHDAYQEHLNDEATLSDYYAEAYADEILSNRREAEHMAFERDHDDAVWCVLGFVVCFASGDAYLATEAVVETLAAMGADFRQAEIDECPF